MTVNKVTENEKLILSPEGMLDTANAQAFEDAIDEATAGTENLIIDFTKVEYISSSGLRVLLKAQKKMSSKNGTLILKNVSESVDEVLEVTGFKDILTIQ